MYPIHLKIEAIRREKGVTKTHIANKCRKSVSWYHGIATGRRKPTVESVAMIAEALEVDIKLFFDKKLSVTLNRNTN
jgi:transcriptional regulator with XRE-family HTH domain